MRFVLYVFSAVTTIPPGMLLVAALESPRASARALDALILFIVPLLALAAGAALGELRLIRVAIERRAAMPEAKPGAASHRGA